MLESALSFHIMSYRASRACIAADVAAAGIAKDKHKQTV
jgi:hypothetical protein